MSIVCVQKHQQNVNKTMNRIDKLRDSIKLSRKKIQTGQKLTKKQKQIIIHYITQDYAFNLSQYIQKRAIKLDSQIGMQCFGWNLLHFAVKCNALQCIEFILKQQYHQYPDQYEKFINTKTIQGYTPLMVAIINQSIQALELLLKYGTVDIHQTDNKKMTPYQLAINYKNQKAIRILMNYQNHLRRRNKAVSKTILEQPMIFMKREQGCCYKSIFALFECLSFGFYSKISHDQLKTMQSNSSPRRRSSMLNRGADYFITNNHQNQQVKISRQPLQQQQYQIVWKDINQIITNLKYPLFQNYNPFDIRQKNIVLKNNLILFQCLSQNPWVVRKIVQIDRTHPNHYNINLCINYEYKKFNINNQIPFLKDRQQPMFIQNQNQMWPMLLQKGLAKAHESYFDLDSVETLQLVQQTTGFPTYQIDIQNYQHLQIFMLLKKIHGKGYLYLLEGTQGSNLSSQSSSQQSSTIKNDNVIKKDCFSVLEFFDKNQKKLILINCPFVDQAWKEKQKYQMHSLKLIKSHFNNHDQMCVWIQFDRIKEYFSKIIVSTTLPNYQRKCFKVKTRNQLFFTYKVQKQRQEKIVVQLINLTTKKPVNFAEIRGYKNQGSQKIQFNKGISGEEFTQGVVSTQNQIGQYMCCIDIDKTAQQSQLFDENLAESLIHSKVDKNLQNYMLIMWSVDGLQPRHLDQTLGPVEFLHWVKVNTMKSFSQSQIYRVQIACDYALIMMMDRENQIQHMYMNLENVAKDDLIQGIYVKQNTIQMLKEGQQGNKSLSMKQKFYYCILRNAQKYDLKQKSSFIKNSDNLDPAGLSSIGKKLNFYSQ